jgi:hypothetical protein
MQKQRERIQKNFQENDNTWLKTPENRALEFVSQSEGQPLDTATRAAIEPQFAHNFADVRVHTDSQAANVASGVEARAFTVGHDVVFNAGEYQPESLQGQALLTHELTHVVQQRGGAGSNPSVFGAHEREAEGVERMMALGDPIPQIQTQTAVGLAYGKGDPPLIEKEILEELERRLTGLKEQAAKLLGDEGMPNQPPDHRKHRTNLPRVGDLKKELRRIVNDPGSPRQKAAEKLLGEIDDVQQKLGNVNKEHPHRQVNTEGSNTQKFSKNKPVVNPTDSKTPTKNPPNKANVPVKPPIPTGSGGSTPVGSTSPRPASPSASSDASRAAVRKVVADHLVSSGKNLAKIDAFVKGLSTFLAVKGALDHALNVLAAIDSMENLLAHGTAMPKEQQQANEVLQQAQQAATWAQSTLEDTPLYSWIPIIDNALRVEDDQGLFSIDSHLSTQRHTLERAAHSFDDLADGLTDNASRLGDEILKQVVEMVTPHTDGTASNAIAFALYESLGKLQGTIQAASHAYREAAQTLNDLTSEIAKLDEAANNAGWDVAQRRARREYQAKYPPSNSSSH